MKSPQTARNRKTVDCNSQATDFQLTAQSKELFQSWQTYSDKAGDYFKKFVGNL